MPTLEQSTADLSKMTQVSPRENIPPPAPSGTPELNPFLSSPLPPTSAGPDALRQFFKQGVPQVRLLPPNQLGGNSGVNGVQGPAGDKGDTGSPGTAGPAGPRGPNVIEGTHSQRLSTYFAWRYSLGALFYETDRTSTYISEDRVGSVTVVGTAVTWGSGDLFDASLVGAPISVNGVGNTVSAVADSTHLTLAHSGTTGAYSVASGKWVWFSGLMEDVYGSRPSASGADMTLFDVGFIFRASDYTTAFRWEYDSVNTTLKWVVIYGYMQGVFASRPANLGSVNVYDDDNFIFYATDRKHAWQWSAQPNNYYVLQPEFSSYQSGNLSAITAGLGSHDVGYRYFASDFNREYTWQGAVWLDSPGQPSRRFVQDFDSVPDPSAGWHLCDGTAGVTVSKSDGTTTTVTVPTLNSVTFRRNHSSYSGPTSTAAVAPTTSAHHHSIVVPDQNTGNDTDAGFKAQADAGGTTVALNPHVHDVASQTFDSADTTVLVNTDGLPKLMDFIPYYRL